MYSLESELILFGKTPRELCVIANEHVSEEDIMRYRDYQHTAINWYAAVCASFQLMFGMIPLMVQTRAFCNESHEKINNMPDNEIAGLLAKNAQKKTRRFGKRII